MNKPYVKHYVNGICINPITKEEPVLTKTLNRRMRRMKPSRPFSNKKGVQVVVARIGTLTFVRYQRTVQITPKEAILKDKEGQWGVFRLKQKGIPHNILIN